MASGTAAWVQKLTTHKPVKYTARLSGGYDHYFDDSQKTVEIKNMTRTVTIPNTSYNSCTGYKGAGTGAMDASMTLVRGQTSYLNVLRAVIMMGPLKGSPDKRSFTIKQFGREAFRARFYAVEKPPAAPAEVSRKKLHHQKIEQSARLTHGLAHEQKC
ncbi:MAG: hypothetical protein Q4G07_00070 [Oscillospiraceae bacterium]|nr:hypothetical protein [Oscillospiraceae bacterium]